MSNKQTLGTAVITGASSGLGAELANQLASKGYNLKLVARRADRLEALATTLRGKYGVTVTNIVADLGAPADLKKVADNISSDAEITMLINNAGTVTLAKSVETTVEKQLEMINVNITGITLLANAVLPGFKARNNGTLINIASVLGLHSLDFTAVYSGTKAYVVNYTRGLQEEFKDTNVRIQVVLPASTDTEIWEVGGLSVAVLPPETVMTITDCVNAILTGLEKGENLTLPSVNDDALIKAYDEARIKLFSASQTGKPASRYTTA
jgi:short-subunit dehydrogenase